MLRLKPNVVLYFRNKGGSMRNALAITLALCMGSALVGCNSNNKSASAPVQKNDAAKLDKEWSLTLQTQCQNANSAEECIGGYGFTVKNNGQYELGPGPNGEKRKGNLSDEELALVKGQLDATLKLAAFGAENHDSIEGSDNEDTVSLTLSANGSAASAPVVLLKAAGTDLSYRTSTADEAKSLLTQLRSLADKYYALPFPDQCTDGTTAVSELFGEMQKCDTDKDCSYFDGSFGLVDSSSTQYLVEDDCSLIKPLIVGNAAKVEANMQKLTEAYNNIRNACGFQLYRADCTAVSGFYLQGQAPVCQQGVCKLNPAR
jgi:hypothetical protein